MNLKSIEKLAHIIATKPDPTGNKFIDEKWDLPEYQQPYYRFLYRLAEKYKPDIVLELGGWQGLSASHFAAGNPDGIVITIDHHTDPGDDKNKGRMINCCKEFRNLNFIQAWTTDEVSEREKGKHALGDAPGAEKWIKQIVGDKKIDILFIDSWHVKEEAQKDWEAYKGYLKKGSLVLVDDCINGTPGTAIDRIREFFDELPGEKVLLDGLHSGYPIGAMIYA